ncbi:MAG: DJ-1 family glyoxalase III [Candidatus Egerieousia sp.]
MKKVFILLAEGAEPVEALAPADILRRCNIETRLVSIGNSLQINCSKGIKIEADTLISDIMEQELPDMLILPGGMPGYENLAGSKEVEVLLKKCVEAGKYIAAICGGPSVLAKYSIAEGCNVTSHSSVKEQMAKYNYTGAPVEADGKIITGKGAGRSIEFAIRLAEILTDSATIINLRKGLEC